ncbi:MAG: GatB/YqeY domain-containing protein [Polyangiales bacterium]
MSIKAKLAEDLKDAMRAKDTVRLETIRSVRAAILQREADGADLDDAAVLEVLRFLRKQRIESIDQYREGGREDLVAQETREKELLEAYLPAAPDRAQIEAVVRDVIGALNATSVKDMGKVMNAAKPKLVGADGKLLSEVVRGLLTSSTSG